MFKVVPYYVLIDQSDCSFFRSINNLYNSLTVLYTLFFDCLYMEDNDSESMKQAKTEI